MSDPVWLNAFNKVNGVMSPSLLKPGQPPIQRYRITRRRHPSVSSQARSWYCPICGNSHRSSYGVKLHFVHCVRRNGNPQGFYWDGTVNEEVRIGRAFAEQYCRGNRGRDQDSDVSTSDQNSDHDNRRNSHEPSVSCNDSQSSMAVRPSLHQTRDPYTGAFTQCRTLADHGKGYGVSEIRDKRVADRDLETAKMTVAGPGETSLQTG